MVCAAVLAAAACTGSDAGAEGPSVQSLEGLAAPSARTVSLAAGDGAAIVVNGGVRGAGGPEARLYAALPDRGSLIDIALPLDEPLYDVASWFTGDEFIVVGLPCPKWTSVETPPDPDLESLTGVAEACGTDN